MDDKQLAKKIDPADEAVRPSTNEENEATELAEELGDTRESKMFK